jgi:hypothetical protein
MTPLACGKIITSKGAFAVVTGIATLRATRGMVIQSLRRGYLTPLR